jgi:hypothetical protein
MICAYCGQEIPDSVIASRHYSPERTPRRVYCNVEHVNLHRQAIGEYKDMSAAGKDARSATVTVSNRVHPRRKSNK